MERGGAVQLLRSASAAAPARRDVERLPELAELGAVAGLLGGWGVAGGGFAMFF